MKKILKSSPENTWRTSVLAPNATLREAAQTLTDTASRICLVLDDVDRLIGIVGDGDIRRGLLKGLTMADNIGAIVNHKPLVVPIGVSPSFVRKLMIVNKVVVIPEVDEDNRVVLLHFWEEIDDRRAIETPLVIMAGGEGRRLRPFTSDCPKPMLQVLGKPILEHIILNAVSQGIANIYITVNYLAEQIMSHFGDGSRFGVKIDYIRENKPLGTAGALSLLREYFKGTIFLTNGDIISDLSYRDLMNFHVIHSATATLAVRRHEWRNPYGVVELENSRVKSFVEKPSVYSNVNAGFYVLSEQALGYLPSGEYCDIPELLEMIRNAEDSVYAYPLHEGWDEIGVEEDLIRVNSRI